MGDKVTFLMVYAGLIIMAVTLIWTCIPALEMLARERRARVLYHLISVLSQIATTSCIAIVYLNTNLQLLLSPTDKLFVFLPLGCLLILIFTPYYYFYCVNEVSKY